MSRCMLVAAGFVVACGGSQPAETPVDAATGEPDGAVLVDAAPACDPAAWRKEAIPDDEIANTEVRGVFGTAADDIWAVTNAGRALHRGASGWTQSAKLAGPLNGVWAASRDDAWVVGQGGFIGHWNGTTWETERSTDDPNPILTLNDVHGASAAEVWAVGLEIITPALFRRDATGWHIAVPPETKTAFNAVWAVGPGHIWVAADDGLYELAEGEWTRRANGAFRDVVVLPSGVLWAVKSTANGKPLCHSLAGVGDCEAFPNSSLASGNGLAIINDSVIVSGTDSATGTLLAADLRGTTWSAVAIRSVEKAFAVWGTGKNAWIGVSEGVLRRGCD